MGPYDGAYVLLLPAEPDPGDALRRVLAKASQAVGAQGMVTMVSGPVARAGSLIAISSMTGKRPLHGRTPYAAAKMGVIGLVRTLAIELGPHGIRVNAVCPGRAPTSRPRTWTGSRPPRR